MATSLTSDTFHRFACSPCSEESVNKEAAVFCENCKQYFCESCLKYHNRFSDLREHQLLDKDTFKHVPTTSNKGGENRDIPTVTCGKHHGKLIDMYCEDHDEIGCNACMTLQHRQCKHLHYIPDIASSRLSQQTIQTVTKDLSDRLDEFKSLKKNQHSNKTLVANVKDECLDYIKERRKAINQYLDREEKTLKDSVTDKYEEINTKLEDDMKTCDESINLLDTMKGKLNTSTNNTSQTFIDLKRAEHAMKETGVKLGECKGNRNDQYTIIYEEGPAVKEVLSRDTLFGNVTVGYKTPNTLNKEDHINVRFSSDKSVCKCYDLCQLLDGTIISTDWNNRNLKSLKYDNTYKQSDSLSMSNSPWGVCTVNDNEVAVTVPRDKKISIISVCPKMSVKSSFSVDSYCYGIAYTDGYLYVGHNRSSKLTVYDLQGQCMNTFSTNHTGTTLFQRPCHLCINPTKQHIIVADSKKSIVIIEKSGCLLAEYMYPNKSWTHGVCMDDSGNVYIADSGSEQLLVLDMDGIVTTLQDNLNGKPTAVHFDEHRQRLLVTFRDKDDIQSFSFH